MYVVSCVVKAVYPLDSMVLANISLANESTLMIWFVVVVQDICAAARCASHCETSHSYYSEIRGYVNNLKFYSGHCVLITNKLTLETVKRRFIEKGDRPAFFPVARINPVSICVLWSCWIKQRTVLCWFLLHRWQRKRTIAVYLRKAWFLLLPSHYELLQCWKTCLQNILYSQWHLLMGLCYIRKGQHFLVSWFNLFIH